MYSYLFNKFISITNGHYCEFIDKGIYYIIRNYRNEEHDSLEFTKPTINMKGVYWVTRVTFTNLYNKNTVLFEEFDNKLSYKGMKINEEIYEQADIILNKYKNYMTSNSFREVLDNSIYIYYDKQINMTIDHLYPAEYLGLFVKHADSFQSSLKLINKSNS